MVLVGFVVDVFVTLTDRASTIPSSIVLIANPVRSLLDRKISEEHLQSSNESMKTKQNERNNNAKNMPEKYRKMALDREGLVKCQPRAIRYPPRIATLPPNA